MAQRLDYLDKCLKAGHNVRWKYDYDHMQYIFTCEKCRYIKRIGSDTWTNQYNFHYELKPRNKSNMFGGCLVALRRRGYNEPKKATLVWDENKQVYVCTFPLHWIGKAKLQPEHELFMALFKKSIDACDRQWAPEEKVWYITEKWLDGVEALCKTVFDEVFVFRKPTEEYSFGTRQYNVQDDFTKFVSLLRESGALNGTDISEATLTEAQKYYRKAAMILHPDRNPANSSKMSELNEVWSRLKGSEERKGFFK